jgi:hypothetical protein
MSVGIGLLVLLLGGVGVAWGYNRRSYHQVVAGTETTRALDVDTPGLVELKGEVVPADGGDTMQAPLSVENCVAAGWEVEEWNESGKSSSWNTIGSGYDAVPFLVDDGSAQIRVEPGTGSDATDWTSGLSIGDLDHSVSVNGATFDFDRLSTVHQVEPGDSTPRAVENFESSVPGVHEQSGSMFDALDFGKKHGERKYKEGTVEPGDDVYLLGTVTTADGDAHPDRRLRPEDAVVRPGDDEFILSTRSEDELLSKSRWGLPAMAAGGLVMAAGLFVLLGA